MECCCHLRSVQDLLAGGRTPHERRFGEPRKGRVSPVGAMVPCFPTVAKDQTGNLEKVNSTKTQQENPFCHIGGHLSSQKNVELELKLSEVPKTGGAPRKHC